MRTIVSKCGSSEVQSQHRQKEHDALGDTRNLALGTTSKEIFSRFFPAVFEEAELSADKSAWVKYPKRHGSCWTK